MLKVFRKGQHVKNIVEKKKQNPENIYEGPMCRNKGNRPMCQTYNCKAIVLKIQFLGKTGIQIQLKKPMCLKYS